jgi:hypothetical protein
MSWVSILKNEIEILLDQEDASSLPEGHEIKFDKDGYPLVYFYCEDLRKETAFRLHRWVMREPKGLIVDHINGNKRDARKSNLRVCTAKQNTANIGKKKVTPSGKTPTSRYKGVCLNRNGKWQAQIKSGGASMYLGSYETEEAAARAYDAAAVGLHGEYAKLNIS